MKFTIERAWIDVVGKGWYGQTMATTYPLHDYELELIGKETKKNVARYLSTNAGDFQKIDGFHAVLKTKEIPWTSEDAELSFGDCMFPS